MPLYDAAHNGKAEPGAPLAGGTLLAGPGERLEQPWNILLGDAFTLVPHRDPEGVRRGFKANSDCTALVGVLDGIAEQIVQHLLDLAWIDVRQHRSFGNRKFQPENVSQ